MRSHFRDFAIYQHNYMVYLRQEADTMGHQNSGLDREKEKTHISQLSLWGLTLLSEPNTITFLGQGVSYHVKVKCQWKYTVLVSQISLEICT